MNLLPKFLVSVHSNSSSKVVFFRNLDKALTSFIWDGKRPRIRLDLPQTPRPKGSLALPNFCHCYWAANVEKTLLRLHSPDTDWFHLEATLCVFMSLHALMTSNLPLSVSNLTSNPVWYCRPLKYGLSSDHISGSTIFSTLGLFSTISSTIAISDSGFSLCQRKCICGFHDLYRNNTLANFEDLSLKVNLPSSDLFQYLQIRHFLQCNDSIFPFILSMSTLDTILDSLLDPKKQIWRVKDCISSLKDIICSKD